MTGNCSYSEFVDAIAEHGAKGNKDARALYRRLVFNVPISSVDRTCAITDMSRFQVSNAVNG